MIIAEKKNEGETGNITSYYLLPDVEHTEIGSSPYPTKILKDKHDENYLTFSDIFKNEYTNIPFAGTLLNMPNYVKPVNETLFKQRKFEDAGVVHLTKEGNAILLSPK